MIRHKIDKLRWVLLLLGTCLFANVSAIEMKSLYEVEVSVADQSEETGDAAVREALQIVLQRMTGMQMIPPSPLLNSVYERSKRYLQSFSYRQDSRNGLTLWSRFEPEMIEKIIRDLQLPYWSSTRPLVMVWLVVNNSGTLTLVDENDRGAASKILQNSAAQRGIPLLLPPPPPAWLTPQTVSNGISPELMELALREGSTTVLVGYLRPDGGNWQITWDLQNGRQHEGPWSRSASSPQALIANGIDRISDILASQFSFRFRDNQQDILVNVAGINAFNDYLQLQNYLTGLQSVDKIQIDAAAGEWLRFRIWPKGNARAVEQMIALGTQLQPLPPPAPEPSVSLTPESTATDSGGVVVTAAPVAETRPQYYYRWQQR